MVQNSLPKWSGNASQHFAMQPTRDNFPRWDGPENHNNPTKPLKSWNLQRLINRTHPQAKSVLEPSRIHRIEKDRFLKSRLQRMRAC